YFRLERELAGLGFHQGEQCALQGTHTNPVENQIRPLTLTRKNSLFAGHDEGGRSWARIASLIATCKINSVEPYAWMKATLEAIATGHPQSRIDELLPWSFARTS
ncbi:transposase domain-containing protein, partial [Bradyrhizobium sp. 31Argb]|uniref:transposase domain-containing protein n=1 Tax=Bradyrhizobium sp. 31Argb TaxID=3141247 RepID=UPI003748591F